MTPATTSSMRRWRSTRTAIFLASASEATAISARSCHSARLPPVVNIGTVVGTYTTPALHVAISGMLTNTHCTSPYRGAGRPEASLYDQWLIDIAADEMNRSADCGAATPFRRTRCRTRRRWCSPMTAGASSRISTAPRSLPTGGASRRGARKRRSAACCANRHLQHHRAGFRPDLRNR